MYYLKNMNFTNIILCGKQDINSKLLNHLGTNDSVNFNIGYEENIDKIAPDVWEETSYIILLSHPIIDVNKYKGVEILNIHPAPLPDYRGVDPIGHQLLDGNLFSNVTLQKVVKRVNTGEILATYPVYLDKNKTIVFNSVAYAANKAIQNYVNKGNLPIASKFDSKIIDLATSKYDLKNILNYATYHGKDVKYDWLNIKNWGIPVPTERMRGLYLENGKFFVVYKTKRITPALIKPDNKDWMTNREFVKGYKRAFKEGVYRGKV